MALKDFDPAFIASLEQHVNRLRVIICPHFAVLKLLRPDLEDVLQPEHDKAHALFNKLLCFREDSVLEFYSGQQVVREIDSIMDELEQIYDMLCAFLDEERRKQVRATTVMPTEESQPETLLN